MEEIITRITNEMVKKYVKKHFVLNGKAWQIWQGR